MRKHGLARKRILLGRLSRVSWRKLFSHFLPAIDSEALQVLKTSNDVPRRLIERAFGIPDAEVAAAQSSIWFMLISLQWLHLIFLLPPSSSTPNYLVSSFTLFISLYLLLKEKMQLCFRLFWVGAMKEKKKREM